MDSILYLAIIIILIVVARISSKLGGIEKLLKKIDQLNEQVSELNRKLDLVQRKQSSETRIEVPEPIKTKPAPEEKILPAEPLPAKNIEPTKQPVKEDIIQSVEKIHQHPAKEMVIETPSYIHTKEESISPEPQEGWFDKWLRNNPDIEKFIGENLVNKIGIAVLVLGIAFFVKYAIDQEWINEIGRVCIGLLSGGILIGFAHRLRKSYKAFSSVLAGGGLAVFYFTIAFAFHQYNLFSQPTAFIIMVIITVFAVTLAVLYDRLEIAILATVGGFLTPFLVSTGNGNYVVLFTYLGILNTGLIVLAFYKRWRVLNFIAFLFTMFIYGGWIVGMNDEKSFSHSGTFIFGTIFYLMFLIMNIIHYVTRGSKLKAFDFCILLAINLGYYSAGMFLLTHIAPDLKGVFTAALGIINLVLGYIFYKRNSIDKNFVYLLIGLTLSYCSLAAPVQLNGNYVTLFWSAEVVVLFWLFQKSRIVLIKIASAIITLLMIISLTIDWGQVYGQIYTVGKPSLLPVVLNKGFITTIVAAVAMSVVSMLFKTEADSYYLAAITNKAAKNIYAVIAAGLFLIAGLLETGYQFSYRFPDTGLEFAGLELYIITFFVALFPLLNLFKLSANAGTRLAISVLLFLLYAANIVNIYHTEKLLLTTGNYKPWFILHWISVLLLIIYAWQTIAYVRLNKIMLAKALNSFSWIIVIAIIVLLSIEVRHLYIWMVYNTPASITYAENLFSKAGLSITWGLSSFILIWLGMKHQFKPLRIIALVLFGITLVKLFVFDISNITPGGKIAAFILLGVLLLIVSFMYQRLKKILIDDNSNS